MKIPDSFLSFLQISQINMISFLLFIFFLVPLLIVQVFKWHKINFVTSEQFVCFRQSLNVVQTKNERFWGSENKNYRISHVSIINIIIIQHILCFLTLYFSLSCSIKWNSFSIFFFLSKGKFWSGNTYDNYFCKYDFTW